MLGDHPVGTMLLATDFDVARRFYAGTLGLEVLLDDEQHLTFRCGATVGWSSPRAPPAPPTRRPRPPGASATSPTKSPSYGREAARSRTCPSWAPPTASPDIGLALAAWVTDPHHNSTGTLTLTTSTVVSTLRPPHCWLGLDHRDQPEPIQPSSFSASPSPSLAQCSSLLSMCSHARKSRPLMDVVMDRQLQITPINR